MKPTAQEFLPDPEARTEALDATLVVIDGPADRTVRPARPNIPREYPRPNLKPRPGSEADQPKES